ncbi:protein-disulfide reductase DsbD family protein [Sphingomonas sp. S1-29]|uniref:protein-disulfide reductase DsbD family protein n=1 Tax=Sphingomonas sp. S1-29 TaxID=2991074 RepID=UPI00223F2C69|nr:thioredoxin family protein [Sphingomonas sp. S1-29]UZK70603.1 protein-disulfide reductase DsbD family protein [Sphingomonas sp. S1-29]
MITRFLLGLIALLVAATPNVVSAADQHISVAITASSTAPRPGSGARVAIVMTPEPGWHAYWSNPGDSGLPPEATWTLPEGVRIGAFEHPAPSLLELGGLASYVHAGTFTLLADLTISPSVPAGTPLPIRGSLSWLACSDSLCVPEKAEIKLDLAAGDGSVSESSNAVFRRAEAALPINPSVQASFDQVGDRLQIEIESPVAFDMKQVRLYPAESGWFPADVVQQVSSSSSGIRISVTTSAKLPARQFKGVLSDGQHSIVVNADPQRSNTQARNAPKSSEQPIQLEQASPPLARVPEIPAFAAPSVGDDAPAIWVALIGALLGGLLLNLMPCVFPILSLKALSLVRSAGNPSAARVEGMAYLAGSVSVTTALGAVLLAARAMGQDIGWSFQLQDPRAIIVLMIMTLAIALNLAGVFNVRGPSLSGGWLTRRDWQGAFGTGALAAVIATPCSGPFMGVALGAALILPPASALAVFAGLGLGMALPFLAIAMFPPLRQLLPKPGAWMETFRRLLAIPMLLTAIGLAWVLGRQSGADGMAVGLVLAMVAALGLWWFGLRQKNGKPIAISLVPMAAALAISLVIELPQPATAASQTAQATEAFTEVRYAELRSAGTPVFVDMTADWCLICQVNKRVAIDRPSTRKAFADAGVVMLVGDWTRGDPTITKFLKTNGRNSIPYYLFSDTVGREHELPQVLTTDMLVDRASAS